MNHNVINNYGTSNVIRVSKRIQNQNKQIKQQQYAYKAEDAVISIEEALSSNRWYLGIKRSRRKPKNTLNKIRMKT